MTKMKNGNNNITMRGYCNVYGYIDDDSLLLVAARGRGPWISAWSVICRYLYLPNIHAIMAYGVWRGLSIFHLRR